MVLLLQYMLLFASVLALVALGGCFSEHSGIINLGLEGIMVVGALGGALVLKYMPVDVPGFITVIVTLDGAIAFGMLYSALLGVAAIHFNADQTLIGTAMNMLATAVSAVIVKAINLSADSSDVSSVVYYIDNRPDLTVQIGGFEFNWFMLVAVVAVIAAYVVLYKTRFGLRLMACGENPQAANSVGIDVFKMRWAGVLISGMLGGLGGIAYITAGSSWTFENGVAGYGFLALAVMIFGQWKPHRIVLAALLFGFFRSLGSVYSGIPLLASMNIPSTVYNLLPYIISLIVLAFSSKNSMAPKAEGIPYDKSTR